MKPTNFLHRIKRSCQNLLNQINKQAILHSRLIEFGTEIVKGATEFAIFGKPVSLLGGVFNAAKELGSGNSYYPEDFFTEANGWYRLIFEGTNITYLFISTLQQYPHQSLKFKYGNQSSRIVSLPLGKVGVVEDSEKYYTESSIFFKPSEIKDEELRKFLIDTFIQKLNTNCFSILEKDNGNWGTTTFVVAESLINLNSKKSTQYQKYIKNCLSKNINRSFLFYGPPGSGKSTLASSILSSLGFRTLKFRYTSTYNFPIFKFLIRAFHIEAVLIDDFDQLGGATELLELLEFLKKEVKVVIAVSNTLGGFHSAVLRVDRIDEIIKIDQLEIETVKSLLGKLYKNYGTKVRKWPVAYIQELVRRNEIGKQLTAPAFLELDKRVKDQIKKLKKLD